MRLNRRVRPSETPDIEVTLTRPDGTIDVDSMSVASGETLAAVELDLRGREQLAPEAGDWRLAVALDGGPPCTYDFRVEPG
jgi:hypothetical protein